MKNKPFIMCTASFFVGCVYLIISHGWISFHIPSYKTQARQTIQGLRAHKRKVKLLFWHNNTWNNEDVEILETNNTADTMKHLINAWLTVLEEDNIMNKKVTLQAALLAPNNQLFISFDRNPFNEQSSTQQKWMWVEGLLKTVRENKMPIQSIRFLVHHQPMNDYHLDFSCAWPLAGFLTNSFQN